MSRKLVVWTIAAAMLPTVTSFAATAKAPVRAATRVPSVKAPPVTVTAAPPAVIIAPPAPPAPIQVDRGPIPQPAAAPAVPLDPKAAKELRKKLAADMPICINAGELKDWMLQNKLDACDRLLGAVPDPADPWTRRPMLLQHRALALLGLKGGQKDALAALDESDALAKAQADPLWDTSGGIGNMMLRAYALNALYQRGDALKLVEQMRTVRPWSVSNISTADALEGTFTNDLTVLASRLEQRQRLDPDVTRFLVYLYLMQGELAKSAASAERLSLVDPRLHGNWTLNGEDNAKEQLATRLRYDCIKGYIASALGKPDQAKAHFDTARQGIIDYVGPDITLLIKDQVRKPTGGQLKAYAQRKLDAVDLGEMVDEWGRLTTQRQTLIDMTFEQLADMLKQVKHKGDLVPGVVELLDQYGKIHAGPEGAEAKLLAGELLRRALGDAVKIEPTELGSRLPRIETLDQIPKFASTASKWILSDGSGYSQSKEGDGEVRTVRYETLVGSRGLVEEMGLLAIANYARTEGKDAFVILSDRTIARTTTVYGYYGIGSTTNDSGFEAQFRIRLLDSKALPADIAAQPERVILISDVEAGIKPRYDGYMARKDAEAAARKAAQKGK